MTLREERKLSMYLGVEEFFDETAVVTATVPGLAAFLAQFLDEVDALQVLAAKQEEDIRGHALDKATKRATLETMTLNIGGRVAAFAVVSDNDVLLQEVNYTETELDHAPDTELVSKATIVRDRANSNIGSLDPDYGVDATMVTALSGAITAYNGVVSSPKVAIGTKKDATNELKEKFQFIDNLLKKKVDVLVGALKITNAEYVNTYNNNRKIDNPAYRKLSMIGRIIDSVTHLGLDGTTIKITRRPDGDNPSGLGPIKVRTGKKGYFRVKELIDGVYDLEISRPGYETKSVATAVITERASHVNEVLVGNL